MDHTYFIQITEDVIDYLSKFTSWDIYNHEVLCFIDGKKFQYLLILILYMKFSQIKKQKALEAKIFRNL